MIVTNPAVKKSLSDASRIEFINDMVESILWRMRKGKWNMSPIILIGLSKCTSMYIVWMEYNLKKLKLKMAEKFWRIFGVQSIAIREVLDLFRKYTEGKLVRLSYTCLTTRRNQGASQRHCGIQETGTYS